MIQALALIIFAYLSYLTAMYIFQRHLIFPAHMTQLPVPIPKAEDYGFEVLTKKIKEGEVKAWFAPQPLPAPLVVLAHGNAELVEHNVEWMLEYHRRGFHVLLPEYRGYGLSAGRPSRRSIDEDFEYFLNLVLNKYPQSNQQLIFHGRSLGGGVVCDLARKIRPTHLILESTYTRLADIARTKLAPSFLLHDNFNCYDVVKSARHPILILHGQQDEVIPFSHAQKNYSANKSYVRLVVFQASHSDLRLNWKKFWHEIDDFLDIKN